MMLRFRDQEDDIKKVYMRLSDGKMSFYAMVALQCNIDHLQAQRNVL